MPLLKAKKKAAGAGPDIPDFLRVKPDEHELRLQKQKAELLDQLKPTQDSVAQVRCRLHTASRSLHDASPSSTPQMLHKHVSTATQHISGMGFWQRMTCVRCVDHGQSRGARDVRGPRGDARGGRDC